MRKHFPHLSLRGFSDFGRESASSAHRYLNNRLSFGTAGFGPEGQLVGVDLRTILTTDHYGILRQEVGVFLFLLLAL